MAFRWRYYEWDGTQDIPPLDPDDILAGITDDLMNFGDLQHALRNLMQRGMRNPQGDRMQGLRDLLQQLRQQRRQRLEARGARYTAGREDGGGNLFIHPTALHGMLMGVSRKNLAWTWSGRPELARA